MNDRSSRGAQAEEDAVNALRSVGVEVGRRNSADDRSAEIFVSVVGGSPSPVIIKSLSRADPSRVRHLIASGPPAMLVADEIPGAARQLLTSAGWAWIDRRGHVRLSLPGILVDTDFESSRPPDRRNTDQIRGVSGLSYAAALLISPNDPPSIREVARRAQLAASTVSDAARALREAALVGADGRPLIPELFWALSDAWRPVWVGLVDHPRAGDVKTTQDLGVLGEPGSAGWALSGDLAALSWRAPLAVGSDHPPSFYIPSKLTFSRALRVYGRAPDAKAATCHVAVAPTPLACSPRYEPIDRAGRIEWFVTHPLFVALDLAADKARGVEILEDWTPEGFPRVW
jgi:hypothetical protein